jgi:putative lipoic acid-binding regulatory protein
MRALAPPPALALALAPRRHRHRPCRAAVQPPASPDGSVPLRGPALPSGLEGLRLTADGELVDERGRALNALGATRFDVAVQAIRGAFPTGDASASTERAAPGQVLDALVKYPTEWLFQCIAAVAPPGRDAFAAEVAAAVRARCGEAAVLPGGVTHAAKGEKYVAVRVRATVQSAADMNAVVEALRKDARVKMAF